MFTTKLCRPFTTMAKQYTLKDTVRKLEEFIPLKYAESWDNVGLLTEPTKIQSVQKCLLTIDLTTAVLEEAISNKVDLIISYHPPLFQSFKRLTTRDTKENIAIKCIENQIAIWSPHSALDSVPDGINDYLASIMGEGVSKPLQYFQDKSDSIRVTISNIVEEDAEDKYRKSLDKLISNNSIYKYSIKESSIECILSKRYLDKLYEGLLSEINNNKSSSVDIVSLDKLPQFNAGSGRLVTLNNPINLSTLSNNIKDKLNLKNLRIATPWQHKGNLETVKIQTIAICAGSGKSVFGRCKADLLFTGELDHHFVLSSIEAGSSVICTEHTNSERGYLPHLKQKLEKLFENSISFIVSTEDRDPLSVY